MHRPDEMGKLPLETTYIYGLALFVFLTDFFYISLYRDGYAFYQFSY